MHAPEQILAMNLAHVSDKFVVSDVGVLHLFAVEGFTGAVSLHGRSLAMCFAAAVCFRTDWITILRAVGVGGQKRGLLVMNGL